MPCYISTLEQPMCKFGLLMYKVGLLMCKFGLPTCRLATRLLTSGNRALVYWSVASVRLLPDPQTLRQ
jgi:hypothetical protein